MFFTTTNLLIFLHSFYYKTDVNIHHFISYGTIGCLPIVEFSGYVVIIRRVIKKNGRAPHLI